MIDKVVLTLGEELFLSSIGDLFTGNVDSFLDLSLRVFSERFLFYLEVQFIAAWS